MEKKKQNLIMIIAILVIVVFTVGITYAALSYTSTSSNQQLVLGDIYMYYNAMNQGITLEDAMPSETYDSTKYFEFTIGGKNTYTKKDIWYDIVLSYGDAPEDNERTIRIRDSLLKFRLVEVVDDTETEIFTNKSYSDLSNKRVYVNTISSSDNDYNKTYRLYMWIANETVVCSGNNVSECDYYLDANDEALDWNKVFASIKVNVTGDFEEKTFPVDMCFNASKVIDTYTYNNSDEAVNKCATYLEQQGFFVGQTSYEDYCRGTDSNNSLENDLKYFVKRFEASDIHYFVDNDIITNVTYGAYITGYNIKCGTDVVIPEKINGYNVIGVGSPSAFMSSASSYGGIDYTFSYPMFDTLTSAVQEPNFWEHSVTSALIIHYSPFANMNLNSIKIPNTVKIIGEAAFVNSSLKEVEIPDSVELIGPYAFLGNKIEDLVIPNSVKSIGSAAFSHNNLSTIVIGNGIEYVNDEFVFEIGNTDDWNAPHYNVSGGLNTDLSSITIDKTCEEIKNIPGEYGYEHYYYPWLGYDITSHPGLTIYGSNNEVCDSFQ